MSLKFVIAAFALAQEIFLNRNIDPEQHLKKLPQTLQNVRSTCYYMPRSPPTPPPKTSILKTTKLCNRNTSRSIDSFINALIKISETVLKINLHILWLY